LTGYLMPSIRNVDKLLPDFRRLPPIGMIRRAPLLRIRKGERKTKPRKAIRLRERTPLAPKEELKDNGSKPEKTIRLKK
ncbi:MAG TPA: hypothetical protein VK206_03155, partial [Anaerolineales bacterium]|nr:hypothetical protein [Anaerolineales bacterium]